ncbi:SusC/RagA family TonB-linked outer membrane protein [Flavobacterium nackdongense]|uniref:SusC/RagA family TonB-linked outer membrane protein n=1 Tax=Flavobacterium nackdongense TaxID=2547394 RepID=A0A4P6YA33_9FLAO|nr:SusC/RagA family TonB-linked outer membrane protein [Flavobacterium nackdongense]QBN19951.1 SusC/RagA family TonB-linked outer membrane protein [Flavobacterium nackdongense]
MKLKFNGILVLLLVLVAQITFAQERVVSGVVSDNTGMPLPGVSVLVKGTKSGAQTDFDGKYSIKATSSQTLIFTFVGMKTQQVAATSAKINIKMQDDSQVLEEVVVSGAVGIKKKKAAVTSSYASINNQELTAAYNPDPVRSLQGKVSGLTINATTNGVSGQNSIRVRSMLSFTGNTEALVVIDNVISTADVLATLPAEIIESVTVLKGAQGAALYGSQGKQGVVLVQTKKGAKAEQMIVTFTSGIDTENISFIPERQTKYGQGWYGSRDPQENGGWGELLDGAPYTVGIPGSPQGDVETTYSTKGSDNIKDFYQPGTIYQNNLNINVGGADSFVNFNLGNVTREFVVDGDHLSRNNFVLTAQKKLNKLTLGGNMTYTNLNTKQANVNAQSSRADYTLLTNLLQAASSIPIGEFKNRGLYGWNGYYQNPFWVKDNNRLNETKNFINFGINAAYEINKHINLSYNGSVQLRNNNQIAYSNAGQAPATADSDFSTGSEFYQSAFSGTYYYGDLMANFNYELSENIGLKFNIGQNMQYNASKRVSQGGTNLDIPGLYNIANVLKPANPSSLQNGTFDSRITATFGNVDLNYKDYLFLNLTGRYEGNSVAAKGNQYYFYPSAGLSFVATKAFDGLRDQKTLSNLKFYANYTVVGSLDPVSAYEILNTANYATGFPMNSGNSYNNQTTITDPNIKPETYTTYEGGINFGFFNDALTLDVAGYMTKTTDLITQASLSTTTGLVGKKTNSGELEGKGYEIDLGFRAFNTPTFKWNGHIGLSHADTKVIDAGESTKVVLTDAGNSQIVADISAVEGKSFPYITGTDWTRDDNGNVIVDSQGRPTPSATFKNLGKVQPDYVLGLTNNFEYKGFGLSFTLDYRSGGYFISQTKYNLTWNGHLVESADFDRNVGFLYPGSVIDNPATATVGDYIPNTSVLTGGFNTLTGAANRTQAYFGQASNLGSFNLIDATQFKVREISLSYSLSKKALDRTGIESLKFSVNARNPFIILADGNRGYADSEVSSQYNNSTSSAAKNPAGTVANTSRNGIGFIGDAQYPSTRTFGFTINTTF